MLKVVSGQKVFLVRLLRSTIPRIIPRKVLRYAAATLLCMAVTFQAQSADCVPSPSGLTSWWPGEDNALDSAGVNNGTLQGGTTFGSGAVGRAFAFNGTSSHVRVPSSASLNPAGSFSIETWVYPRRNPSSEVSLVAKWGDTAELDNQRSYGLGLMPGMAVDFFISDLAHQWDTPFHTFATDPGAVTVGAWYHVVGVYDQPSGTRRIFINGVQVKSRTDAPITVLNGIAPLAFGAVVRGGGSVVALLDGLLDEISLYNRALSPDEVHALYNAGSAGKCGLAPRILIQPQSKTAYVGDPATFTVTAGGSPPLQYQWKFNGTNLAGATGTSFTVGSAQLTDGGDYSVLVTNSFGFRNSSNATLTVNPLPPCSPPSAGLVSWWAAEGNPDDRMGLNNGALAGNAGYTPGRIGQGFTFDGRGDGVNVGSGTSLRLQNFTVEAWIKRTSDSVVSFDGNGNGQLFAVSSFGGFGLYMDTAGRLHVDQLGGSGVGTTLSVTNTSWHHVAVTKSQSSLVFYVDGVSNVAPAYTGTYTFGSAAVIGAWIHGGVVDNSFYGSIDELAVYNRALSGEEIRSIYLADGAGKCHQAPAFIEQPLSQVVLAGSSVTFGASVVGTAPLTYQWRRNGTNLSGATDLSLTLSNVQTAQAGTYSLRVTNAFGPAISADAILTVNHAPVAQCTNVTISAGADCLANVSVDHGSFDADGDPIILSQTPVGPYPLGTNSVMLTVADVYGASNSCNALVIVQDTTPPSISCPGGRILEFQDENGAVATYSLTATDSCSSVSVAVTPPSGSVFPIGVTSVVARATDASSNSAQCSFTVTVLGAQGVKSNVLAQLTALRDVGNLSQTVAQKLDDAIEHLAGSLNPTNWIDQTHLHRASGNKAINEEKLAAIALADLLDKKGAPLDPAVLQGCIDRIVRCDRLLAVISIEEAARTGLNAKKIAEDLAMVGKGAREADAGHYGNAIEHYRNAWRHAIALQVQLGLNADGSTRLRFVGNNSKSYWIEVSEDLLTWTPLGSCTADAEGNVEFTDPSASSHTSWFYRAIEE